MSAATKRTVKIYSYGLKVTLFRMVDRRNGIAAPNRGAIKEVDLTPLLGERGGVQTAKGLLEAAGGFSITFPDQYFPLVSDSAYALIEPMDMIEIRASHTPEKYSGAGQKLPLLMRGFVSSVRRVEVMGQDGTPSRVVSVQGQDFGKLWNIHAVWPQMAFLTDVPMLTQFQLQAALGIRVAVMGISDFMRELVLKVLNAKIADLSAITDSVVKPFSVAASVMQGQVIPNAAGVMQPGSLWSIVERFADRPWNEVFIAEGEDGPVFTFRPAPFYDIGGNLIMPGAADPGTVAMDIEAVTSLDMMRSDSRVANFFWTPPGSSSIDTNAFVSAAALANHNLFETTYGNNLPAIYGEKLLEAATALVPDSVRTTVSQMPPNEQAGANASYVQWYEARASQLRLMNRDNSVLEEGSATVWGSEDLVIGKYLQLTRGDLVSKSYMVRVSHSIAPLNNWTTTLTLQRGTGYLERNKMPNAYLAEGMPGAYAP